MEGKIDSFWLGKNLFSEKSQCFIKFPFFYFKLVPYVFDSSYYEKILANSNFKSYTFPSIFTKRQLS